MKIAISSMDKDLSGSVSEVFGRCSYFVIAEIKDQKIEQKETVENKSMDQASGAGILAAKLMAERNIDAIITNNIGPRALDILKQFNIKVYFGEGKTEEALQNFIEKKLEEIN